MKTLKQEIAVALLSNIQNWIIQFDNLQQSSKYVGVNPPKTDAELIELSARVLAKQLDVTASIIEGELAIEDTLFHKE